MNRFLQNLARRWWIVVICAALGVATAVGWLALQPTPSQAQATYLFRIGDMFKTGRSALPALDRLTREPDIMNSAVRIASSRETLARASSRLNIAPDSVTVDAELVGGSTVLAITARGADPLQVVQVVNAVGSETAATTHEAYAIYDLVPLDAPTAVPVRPNRTLAFVFGGLVGVLAGIGIAWLLPVQE